MNKVGILGSRGYVAKELIRLLLNHPDSRVECLVSESETDGKNISTIFKKLRKSFDMKITTDIKALYSCDLAITSKPADNSLKNVPKLLKEASLRVIDMSAAYRFKNHSVYKTVYGQTHTSPKLLKESVYGLTELYRDKVKNARLVANPGCYPVSVILGCAPLLKEQLVDPEDIIVDAYSGVSGAGANPANPSNYLFCEMSGNMMPYKVCEHRHAPEMEQELGLLAQCDITMTFVPHVAPLRQGILSTIYLKLEKSGMSLKELMDLYTDFYKGEYFVRLMEAGEAPSISNVVGTNFCDIGIFANEKSRRVVVISAIDNLIKGASGQAIQNMNVMFGNKETAGLTAVNADVQAHLLANSAIEQVEQFLKLPND